MANVEGCEESLDEVRATGASEHQIDHWRRQGLIVCVRQEGRGHGEGSVSYYKAGTVRLVNRLLALLTERRNQDQAILRLWLEGHPVADLVHPILKSSVKKFEAEMASLEERYKDVVENRDSDANLSLPRGAGWIRHRLKEHYFLLVGIVVRAYRGKPSQLRDPEEVKAFRRLINELARRFGWPAELASALREDREGLELLIEIAADVLPHFKRSVDDLSGDALAQIRRHTVRIAKLWGDFEEAQSQLGIIGLLYTVLFIRLAGFSLYELATYSDEEAVESLLTSEVRDVLSTGVLPWEHEG